MMLQNYVKCGILLKMKKVFCFVHLKFCQLREGANAQEEK